MIFKLNETTYLNSGLSLFAKGRLTDALKMFNKCSSYEGRLNKVLLNFAMGEFLFGSQNFFELYLDFRDTHNVFCDVFDHLNEFKHSLRFFSCERSDKKLKANKKNANHDLLINFPPSDDEDFDIDFDLILGDEKPSQAWFADTKSNEFQEMLLSAVEKSQILDDESIAEQAKEKLLLQKTDYVQTIFFQLEEFLRRKQFDKAVEAAKQICQTEELEFTHLLVVAETLAKYGGSKGKKQATQLIEQFSLNALEFLACDIDDALRFTFNVLKDFDLAEKFALVLKDAPDCRSENLFSCFHVFLYTGKLNLAREILVEIQTLFPNSLFAEATFKYFDKLAEFDFKSFEIPKISESVYRHFNIAEPIVFSVLDEAGKRMDTDSTFVATEEDLFLLSVLLYKLPSMTWENSTKNNYSMLFNIVNCIVQSVELDQQNFDCFKELTQKYCYQIGVDTSICSELLYKVLSYKKSGKFFLNSSFVCYTLDLKLLKNFWYDPRKATVLIQLANYVELKASNIEVYSENFDFLRANYTELFEEADDMQVVCFVYGRTLSASSLQKSGLFTKQNAALLNKIKKLSSK